MGLFRKKRPLAPKKGKAKKSKPKELVVIGDETIGAKRRSSRRSIFTRRKKTEETFTECSVCFEEQSSSPRTCCGTTLCDHCYMSKGHCPACGVSILDGKPVVPSKTKDSPLERAAGEEQYESALAKSAEEAKKDHIECRICLDPGTRRKCCGGCFCDSCYFRTPNCPACRKPTANRGLGSLKAFVDPGVWPVLLGACVTVAAIGALVALASFAIAVDRAKIRTLHGYTCSGYFPKCDRFACVEISNEPLRESDDELRMTNMVSWRKCDADTTASLRGSTCVFDHDLWVQSGHTLGYDFCVGSVSRDQSTQIDGKEEKGARFTDGAYIFGDEFELDESSGWRNASSHKSSVQKDALWQYIDGARVDGDCGGHTGTSLHFFGPTSREAVTQPLDLRHGGFLNFRLKMAPARSDSPSCRANFGKAVSVYYSISSRIGWTQFATLESADYGHAAFHYVSLQIPRDASTNTTQFKLSQPTFERESNHWALDDVRIFRNFEPGWQKTREFKKTVEDSRRDVGLAQCCFHTDQCEESHDHTRGDVFKKGCDDVSSMAVDKKELKQNLNDEVFRLNGAYLYVSLAGLAAFYASCYWCIRNYFTVGPAHIIAKCFCCLTLRKAAAGSGLVHKKRVYVNDAHTGNDDDGWDDTVQSQQPHAAQAELTRVNLKRVFKLEVDSRWQRKFAMYTIIPLVAFGLWALSVSEGIILYSPLHAYQRDTGINAVWLVPVPSFFVFMLASFLDVRVLLAISKDVVCLLPQWVPMIHLDMDPKRNCLDVGHPTEPKVHIPLSWMEETSRFTKQECERLAALYVVTCQPWALATLCLGSLKLPYFTVDRWFVPMVGCVVIARAFAGPHFLVKFALGANYLFARTPLMRDQIGAALRHRRTTWIIVYTVSMGMFLSLILVPSDQSGHATTKNWEIVLGIAVVSILAAMYALIVGCLQGLPITPELRLTKLDGGLYFTFLQQTTCPCHEHFQECSDMHSRKKIVVFFLEDIMSFVAILQGKDVGDS